MFGKDSFHCVLAKRTPRRRTFINYNGWATEVQIYREQLITINFEDLIANALSLTLLVGGTYIIPIAGVLEDLRVLLGFSLLAASSQVLFSFFTSEPKKTLRTSSEPGPPFPPCPCLSANSKPPPPSTLRKSFMDVPKGV